MKRIDKDCINVLGKNLNNYEAEKLANDILDELQYQKTRCTHPLIRADFDCVNCVRWQDDCEGVGNER